jgi:nicotinate-nucleotide adenylyltransferase
MKIGVLGGTFNPIHFGHMRAAEEAREILSLDKVLFIPSGSPPLKTRDVADALQRYKMARLAIVRNRFFDVMDIECVSPGKSFTVNTIATLLNLYSGSDIYFMLGIDAFIDIVNWWKPEKLISMVNFTVLSRPGSTFVDLLSSPYLDIEKDILMKLDEGALESFDAALQTGKAAKILKISHIDISSTDIRRRIRERRSIKYLLPEEVESFIISNRLYLP